MKKMLIAAAFIAAVCLGAFAGSHIGNRQNLEAASQKSRTMISFSIGKIEDLKSAYDADTMEALISNVYTASSFAPDDTLSSALHELWNALIFDGENIVGKEDELISALQSEEPQIIEGMAAGIRG